MAITRRRFLTGAAASGAVLLARPQGVLAHALGPVTDPGAARASRLFPGTWLVHADLHNHTLFSDGDGDPAAAFASMRDNGLDVAALTDHSVLGGPLGAGMSLCGDPSCTAVRGIDEASWADTATLADAADDPGTFCAIRGFEWSSPTLGHVNVWFGQDWVDPERTAGLLGLEGLAGYLDEVPGAGPIVGEPLESLVADVVPEGLSMAAFYSWLRAEPGHGLLGGGADAIAGFNHPGREPGRFGMFAFDARLVDRIVSLELFNRREDYLFEGTDAGRASPLPQCLDAGWRVGLLGVTDEHGRDWGAPEGKGRAGLWVRELSRAGVREALAARRFFATRERGLRLDAALGGQRMGGTVAHRAGPLVLTVDLDGGPAWVGREVVVQILRPGGMLPAVASEERVRVPAPGEPVIALPLQLDVADGTWVVARVVDPDDEADGRAVGALAAGRALAYTSPWWLDPGTRVGSDPPPGPEREVRAEAGREVAPVPAEATEAAPIPSPATLPATGALPGPGAVGTGLALGASLAAGAGLRLAAHAGHDHDRAGHDHAGHDHDHAGHDHDRAGHDRAGHDHGEGPGRQVP